MLKKRHFLLFLIPLIAAGAFFLLTRGGDSDRQVDGEDIVNFVDPVEISGALITWIGEGSAPGRQNPANPGQIVRISGEGKRDVLLSLPAGTTRVMPCSERASSPDGRYFTFYAGHDSGTLYLINHDGDIEKIDDVGGLSCLGMGTFQYADDSSRLAYIDYDTPAIAANAPTGTLIVRRSSDREEQGRYENAIAFDLTADSLAYLGLFSDNRQAGVFYQTDGAAIEVSTLMSADRCSFRSGDIEIMGENTLVISLGSSCNTGNSRWDIYTVDISTRSSTPQFNDSAGGGYFGNVRINSLFAGTDTGNIFFTVPNGLASDNADLYTAALDGDAAPRRLVRNVVMPEFVLQSPHKPDDNADAAISPDRRWLAITSNTANNEAAVNIIDLNNPDPVAVSFSAGNRGDTVSAMAFSQDSSRLFFVAGGHDGEDNALFSINMSTLIDERVSRNRFGTRLVAAADASAVVLADWNLISEPVSDRYMDLVQVNISTASADILRTGADLTATRLTNRRFFFPLQWR